MTKNLLALTLAASFLVGAASLVASEPAHAAAAMAKTAAPGYYRIMLGDFEVTALSDGTADLPVDQLLTNTTPEAVNKALAAAYLSAPLETSFNAFLINTGDKLVLIDTGAGALFGPTLGRLLDNLKASGYTPEQVDEVLITHMHPDHVGGLVKDGKIVFPNAVIRAERHESDYWLAAANLEKAADADKGFFQGAMASLGPYVAAGKFQPFDGDTEIVPGIRALSTPGHTPGHASYLVESQGKKLAVWGDLVHVQEVQFDHPEVTIHFDSDAPAAEQQRLAEFKRAAEQGYLVAGAHLSFPGIGHVRSNGKAYAWLPITYARMR